MPRAASPTPRRSKQWKALGPSWMPAPISPSWLAFSSTREAMPFWASASAAASPPMPPPAMRILSRSTHDLLVMQPGDLVVRQAENTRQDLVRMLAQHRRRRGRLARHGAELQWRGGHRIAADAGLVEDREQRIVEHVGLVGRKLTERLVGRPQRAGFLQGDADFLGRLCRDPGFDERTELGAGQPAAGIGLEIAPLGRLDLLEGSGDAAGAGQGIDMAV